MTESDADFVRTKPGYGRLSEQLAAMQTDVIEAMATIGAGRVWRRTGQVVYATGWEASDVDWWYATGAADDGSMARTDLYAHRGNASLQIIPSSASVWSGIVMRRGPFIPTTRTGLESSVWMSIGATEWIMRIDLHDGTDWYMGQVIIDPVNLEVRINMGIEVKVADLRFDWRDVNMNFHNVKLVVNYETKKYEGLFIDDRKWDLSEYQLFTSNGNPASYYLELSLIARDTSGDQNPSYVDDFIHTVDEPAGLFK